eukprot:m.401030 g.401030  ORF g.401030 m.401030 type:complete len:60 (+) comp16785_c1_seq12:3966-4145(+)
MVFSVKNITSRLVRTRQTAHAWTGIERKRFANVWISVQMWITQVCPTFTPQLQCHCFRS